MTALTLRLATAADLDGLRALMQAAIAELQQSFLTPAEIAASHAVMGLDTQLIADGAYFVAEIGGSLAGSGGWSWRTTLYGGDHSVHLRNDAVLEPGRDAARIRAMYTHPAFARRGVGRAMLAHCEAQARAAGFTRAELMATLAGEPLYRAAGYRELERVFSAAVDGARVPLIRMGRDL